MSYEANSQNLGVRPIGGGAISVNGSVKQGPTEGAFTTEATTRVDNHDAAANDTQAFTDVADTADAVIGTVQHVAPQSGNVYTWSLSGTNNTDFTISNQGVLSSAETLTNSPYAIVARYQEGSPLHRFRDVELTITVAA